MGVLSHYTFPSLIVNGTATTEWQYVRMTANHYSNGPVTDVTSDAIRCYELDGTVAGSTSIATVSAGSTVGFKASPNIYHQGYSAAYLSKADPSANSTSAGQGSSWFKIWEWAPVYTPGSGFTFPSEGAEQITFKIPAATPSGQYLLRGEHIALHSASSAGGAQYYLSCAQLNIVNGGNGSPGPTVSFPGAYSPTDPGLLLNIYSPPAGYSGYTSPGPAVWSG
ncbi:lytic polysaccharide monooxygenase [Cylindrobasidium torrendii FP15055 ss-10]|uniref:lytic cellulose monooxygenase (C4-dehydrogenating) n=1 Tax=Cylindrobasidium torrendii FP15055 ss-10 TaxID=1314674 RepID=A0A0D7BQ01_9AGAR|nr:lytic polysaccharide monooxygenase [Cylindrobasidium torrendii FP15055 ss-10]